MEYLVGWKPDGDLHYVNKGADRSVQLVAVGPQASRVAANGLRALVNETSEPPAPKCPNAPGLGPSGRSGCVS